MAIASIEVGVVTIWPAYMGGDPVVERDERAGTSQGGDLAAASSVYDGVVTICTAYVGSRTSS